MRVLYSAESVADYVSESVSVVLPGGAIESAVCYNLSKHKLEGANSEYANALLTLANRLGLPDDYLQQIRSAAQMTQSIIHIALVVRDYDEAIAWYTKFLNFRLVEDQYQAAQDKRWVLVAPPGSEGASLLLAQASNPEQAAFVGNQAGGRVFLFLSTDDFWRDYKRMLGAGVRFVRPPSEQAYGTVAVFEDLYGNRWDLVQYEGALRLKTSSRT